MNINAMEQVSSRCPFSHAVREAKCVQGDEQDKAKQHFKSCPQQLTLGAYICVCISILLYYFIYF